MWYVVIATGCGLLTGFSLACWLQSGRIGPKRYRPLCFCRRATELGYPVPARKPEIKLCDPGDFLHVAVGGRRR